MGEFLPKNVFIDTIAKTFCKSKLQAMCTNILFILAGKGMYIRSRAQVVSICNFLTVQWEEEEKNKMH